MYTTYVAACVSVCACVCVCCNIQVCIVITCKFVYDAVYGVVYIHVRVFSPIEHDTGGLLIVIITQQWESL